MSAPRRCLLWLSAVVLACGPDGATRTPQTADERASYAIGLQLGMRLSEMRAAVDPEEIVAGFGAGLASDPADAGELGRTLERFEAETREARRASLTEAALRNERSAAAFLAENRTRPGVVELASGVQYRVTVRGDGAEAPPSLEDRVTVDYEGRLLDGAVFDTSRDRFAPTIVRLRRTPAAWQEVLPRVAGGETVEIWAPGVPSAGAHPLGLVGPGELAVFTIRLVAIDRHSNLEVARAPP